MVRGNGEVGPCQMSILIYIPLLPVIKSLYEYYFIPLLNGPMIESVVFLHKHTVLNVLAF